jgi:hypothetical protein
MKKGGWRGFSPSLPSQRIHASTGSAGNVAHFGLSSRAPSETYFDKFLESYPEGQSHDNQSTITHKYKRTQCSEFKHSYCLTFGKKTGNEVLFGNTPFHPRP